MTTIFQDDAARFATRADDAITHERNATREKAMRLILDGMPGRAQYELARSVVRQARMAGLGTPVIEPACPCGRGCRP